MLTTVYFHSYLRVKQVSNSLCGHTFVPPEAVRCIDVLLLCKKLPRA